MARGAGTDAELVARAGKGDLEAFDRLVMRHRSRLYGIARHITGDSEAAQDVVQEAFLSAFRSLGALRDGARFGHWLNTIVRRESTRRLRDGRREAALAQPGAVQAVIGGACAGQIEAPAELVSSVRDALAVLTERDRRVMVLHYLDGFTCEEIAAKLAVSAGGVKRILHNSRRKVRREVIEMAEAEKERRGPRGLFFWTSGDAPEGKWDPSARLAPALAQAVCLSVSKLAKTTEQVAREVEAHTEYVSDAFRALDELELTGSPRKGRHLLKFIALSADDWRRLAGRVREPAAETARRLTAAQDRLREAFERAPVAAAGWTWRDVTWVFYSFMVGRAVSRAMPSREVWPPPARPGGFRYWAGGRENEPDTPHLWTIGFCGGDMGGQGLGYFGTSGAHGDHLWLFERSLQSRRVLQALLDGPLTEAELLARVEGDPDDSKSKLADGVQRGLAERADGQFRLTMPVFTAGDSDVLMPEIDAAVAPIMAEVLKPTWADLDKLLDQMGYEHLRDQYTVWRQWLIANVVGESLRFLVEQSVLPRLGDDPPAKWCFVAWKGDLPMMSLL